jgi:hypothetical protein
VSQKNGNGAPLRAALKTVTRRRWLVSKAVEVSTANWQRAADLEDDEEVSAGRKSDDVGEEDDDGFSTGHGGGTDWPATGLDGTEWTPDGVDHE